MISNQRIKTNHLLMDELNYWDELTIKYSFDSFENNYFIGLMQLINQQLDNGIEWLDSKEARDFFYGEIKYQKEVFESLESQWDRILNGKYKTIDDIINEVYDYGKIQGYQDIQSRLRYTEADKLALTATRNYNYQLIRKLDDDLRRSIKNRIFQGVISGENPRALAPKLVDLGLEPLPNSTLSARQRAVMIARTEVSRAQNTGILQSYVNEGYDEVKILTAEDNNVCYLCLKNAYEFNGNDEITFENRGKELVHNIQSLIERKQYVPLHPNCRCTYLSVWKRNRNPPKNPYTVDLTNEESHNWSYDYKNKKYKLQGDTPLSRKNFLDKYGIHINDLNPEEELFLRIFTKDSSSINNYLRFGGNIDDYAIEWKKVNLELIDRNVLNENELLDFGLALNIYESIFNKYCITLDEDIILCRRERNRHMIPDDDGKYNDNGFTSTSIYEYAKENEYGDEISYILIPNGTPILYLEGITSSPEDFEVLFPPGIQLSHIKDLGSKKKLWKL